MKIVLTTYYFFLWNANGDTKLHWFLCLLWNFYWFFLVFFGACINTIIIANPFSDTSGTEITHFPFNSVANHLEEQKFTVSWNTFDEKCLPVKLLFKR